MPVAPIITYLRSIATEQTREILPMIKCTFCNASISHIGDQAIDGGWGKVILAKGGILTVAHCPLHANEYVDLVFKLAQAPDLATANKLIQEAQRDR